MPSPDPEPEERSPTEPSRQENTDAGNDEFFSEFPDDTFIPPEPPPLPIFAPATVVGTAAVLVGLASLFYPNMLISLLGVSTELALLVAGIVLLAGAATLVSRLRNPDPDEPTDPDVGAQV